MIVRLSSERRSENGSNVSAKPKPQKQVEPPKGFTPIPGSKCGGHHKEIADGVWATWYPDVGQGLHPTERFTQSEHKREHAAFRASTEGVRETARESVEVLAGKGKLADASPHARRVVKHLKKRLDDATAPDDKVQKTMFGSQDDALRSAARAEGMPGKRLNDPTERMKPIDVRPSPTAIRRLLAEWKRKVKGSTNARAVQAAIGKGNYTEAKRLMELDMAAKVEKSAEHDDLIAGVTAWADSVIKGGAGLDGAWLDATLRDGLRDLLRWRSSDQAQKTDEQLARDVSDRLVTRVLGYKDSAGADRLARLLKDDEEAVYKRCLKLVPAVRAEFPSEAAALPSASPNGGVMMAVTKLAVPSL